MSEIFTALGALAVAIWLYLVLGRGFFWWPSVAAPAPEPSRWPSVVAVVPARDEAETIGAAMGSLLAQDYPGEFSVVLSDDHSSDGTAEIARRLEASGRLRIVSALPLPPGWTGKLWALSEGVRAAPPSELLLFTDADIAHHPTNLRELAARLEHEKRDLVSLMVRLHCQSFAERFLIPAFVFFFAMLYPFRWSNDPARRIAAAAGGCILIRRDALDRIGGLSSIRGELIDDCALARAVKRSGGSLWLGLSDATRSLRPYPDIADIWNMIARSAYTQLRYSPVLLAGTAVGMIVTYLAPVALLFVGGVAFWLGLAAWLLMSLAYLPMVRFYRLAPSWSLLLPAAGFVYLAATIASAWRHGRGKGVMWKGRVEWRNAP